MKLLVATLLTTSLAVLAVVEPQRPQITGVSRIASTAPRPNLILCPQTVSLNL